MNINNINSVQNQSPQQLKKESDNQLVSSSFKKLPTYQPVLLTGSKPAVVANQQQQNQFQQQLPQQQSPISTQNYTVHTVMPHYHHTPQNNQQHHTQKTSYFNQQQQQQSKTADSTNVNMKTFPQQQQGLMSLIPQAQKPLPLYVPFERRK